TDFNSRLLFPFLFYLPRFASYNTQFLCKEYCFFASLDDFCNFCSITHPCCSIKGKGLLINLKILSYCSELLRVFQAFACDFVKAQGRRISPPCLPSAYPASSPLWLEERVSHCVINLCISGESASAMAPHSSWRNRHTSL